MRCSTAATALKLPQFQQTATSNLDLDNHRIDTRPATRAVLLEVVRFHFQHSPPRSSSCFSSVGWSSIRAASPSELCVRTDYLYSDTLSIGLPVEFLLNLWKTSRSCLPLQHLSAICDPMSAFVRTRTDELGSLAAMCTSCQPQNRIEMFQRAARPRPDRSE